MSVMHIDITSWIFPFAQKVLYVLVSLFIGHHRIVLVIVVKFGTCKHFVNVGSVQSLFLYSDISISVTVYIVSLFFIYLSVPEIYQTLCFVNPFSWSMKVALLMPHLSSLILLSVKNIMLRCFCHLLRSISYEVKVLTVSHLWFWLCLE